ncbi:hypothetical protein [Streptomyces sp. NBC_01789]|uniref:hypothetical protein n=1 Tax=Streptomyces sp. NBC_01789 TaxID=2975941 RepID=UPI00224E5643|nr:hypothetical protein [Streptomyces sp. NBC_01789]MCX4447655.1 hypothetical protein [Streptomyces sp. NBC_01789]
MPCWIPVNGHALRHAGIHFDAVRITGSLGEQVAYELMQFTDFQAGPIVRSSIGMRSMYFLVPPGTARAYRWPAGADALTRKGSDFVGVPALHGMTYPLDWRSAPTVQEPFVETALLFELLTKVVTDEIPAVR